jgi:hypothetical protein
MVVPGERVKQVDASLTFEAPRGPERALERRSKRRELR